MNNTNDNKMDSITHSFYELFKSNTTIYSVPFFQRGYVWQKHNWEKLFDTINTSVDARNEKFEDTSSFLGTVVLKKINDNYHDSMVRYSIIDGQQRLISCYVLLLLLKKKIVALEEHNQSEHYISSKYQNIVQNTPDNSNTYNEMKINSPRNDSWSICKILHDSSNIVVDDSIQRIESRNIELFIKYVNRRLQKEVDSIEKGETLIETVLNDLQVACIYLPSHFNEQIIFETLNAFGVPLTPSELICNYLFAQIRDSVGDRQALENKHKQEWLTIEQDINRARDNSSNTEGYSAFESFIRYALSIGQDKMLPKERRMYHAIKRLYPNAQSASDALENIVKYSTYFQYYVDPVNIPNNIDASIKNKIKDLSKIGIHSTIPFVMCLLDRLNTGTIDTLQCNAILSILTSLLVRNRVINSNPKYDVFFPNLMDLLERKSQNSSRGFLDIIKDRKLYVTDDEFKQAFIEQILYRNRDKKFPLYVLVCIDKQMTKHNQSIDYNKFNQIEHVMPNQSYEQLSPAWKSELGKIDTITAEQVNAYATAIQTIGNLTILGYGNQSVQDKHISEKIKHTAYTQSTPPLTQHVIDTYSKNSKWNVEIIKKRSSELAEIACKIWNW